MYLSDVRSSTPVRQLHAHTKEVTSLTFTNDGRLITTGADNSLKVFDTGGQEIFQIEMGDALRYVAHIELLFHSDIFRCAFTNGDQLLLGGDEGVLRAWNLIAYEELAKLCKPTQVPIVSIDASESGNVTITGDNVGNITLWTLPDQIKDQ